MQSAIILGSIENTRIKADEIVKDNNISKFDVNTLAQDKAIGIPDIRNLQKNIFLKPAFSEKKIIIIESFNQITIDAQNAFLKILEEPPQNTIILILTTSLDFLLPTILSRCNLINLSKTKKPKDNFNENLKLLNEILDKKQNPLVIAQNFGKNKETALSFLEDLIITVEKNIDENYKFSKILKALQQTHRTIKTSNVSPRFALENLFLNL